MSIFYSYFSSLPIKWAENVWKQTHFFFMSNYLFIPLNLQYKSERTSLSSLQDWGERPDASTPVKEEGALSSKNTNGFGVKSLEQHMAGLNLLESK